MLITRYTFFVKVFMSMYHSKKCYDNFPNNLFNSFIFMTILRKRIYEHLNLLVSQAIFLNEWELIFDFILDKNMYVHYM